MCLTGLIVCITSVSAVSITEEHVSTNYTLTGPSILVLASKPRGPQIPISIMASVSYPNLTNGIAQKRRGGT